MTASTELDLDQLERVTSKATQGEWWIDSHGHRVICLDSLKTVFATDSNMGPATRHPETGNLSHWPNDWDASYVVAAQPKVVLELIRRLRVAEQLAAENMVKVAPSRGDTLVMRCPDMAVAADIRRGLVGRLPPGIRMMLLPADLEISALDEDDMRAAGWVRAPAAPKPEPKCPECQDDLCGGTRIYDGRECNGLPF